MSKQQHFQWNQKNWCAQALVRLHMTGTNPKKYMETQHLPTSPGPLTGAQQHNAVNVPSSMVACLLPYLSRLSLCCCAKDGVRWHAPIQGQTHQSLSTMHSNGCDTMSWCTTADTRINKPKLVSECLSSHVMSCLINPNPWSLSVSHL